MSYNIPLVRMYVFFYNLNSNQCHVHTIDSDVRVPSYYRHNCAFPIFSRFRVARLSYSRHICLCSSIPILCDQCKQTYTAIL